MTAFAPCAPARLRRGMTLMEVMVAIAITGMMTLAGYGAFASLIDHRRALRDATFRLERAAALRETIDGWLVTGRIAIQIGGLPAGRTGSTQGIRPPPRGEGDDTQPTQSSATSPGLDEEITVTTTALTPALTPNTRVRLYIDADERTPERGLAMEYQSGQLTGLQRRGLDSTITAMLVELLDERTRRWVRPSQVTSVQPMAVRLTFSSTDPSGVDSLPSILRLPIVRSTTDPTAQRGLSQSISR
jgi:prepilin-type N-terminal cleavage/methylation domain-containing protein